MYRDRRQTGSCQKLKSKENREGLLNGYGIVFWSDENVLEVDSSDGFPTR